MTSRPNWLEVFRVKKRTSGKRAKPIYVDSKNNVVKPTHYNLQRETYYVPKSKESYFLSRYIEFDLETKTADYRSLRRRCKLLWVTCFHQFFLIWICVIHSILQVSKISSNFSLH